MENLFDAKDKGIVVTGGAGVLCGTTAKYLARLGAKVCLVDYDVFRVNKLATEIEAEGNFAIPVQANVLEAFIYARDTMGGIDVLINGAGGNKKEATTSEELSFFDMPDAAKFVTGIVVPVDGGFSAFSGV